MTRQKKEIIRKMDEIQCFIDVDSQLACGCTPPGAYDSLYETMWALGNELALLSHYDSYEAMMQDVRGYDPEIPFI